MASWKSRNGQSALEVIIALALLVLTSTASFVLIGTALTENQHVIERARADRLVREGIEAVRQIRNQDWESLVVGTYGLARSGANWAFSGTQDVTDGFTRAVTVTDVGDDNVRGVSVEVTWNPSPLRSETLASATHMANWLELETWGNWGLPVVVGSLDIGPEGKATGVSLFGTQVVLTAESASGSKPSFFTINVNDPLSPYFQGNLTTSDDLRDVWVHEDQTTVYVAGTLDNEELRVFDVSDPASPVQVAALDLNADGHNLYLLGTTLYVGAANGLHIFDISDQTSPVELGSLNLGVDARSVAVIDGIAYVATPNDDQEIMIVDVSTPSAPVKVAYVNVSGSRDGLSVEVKDSRLYLGTMANPSTNPEFYIFDRSTPTAPTLLKSIDIQGDLNSMKAAGPFVFMACNVSNEEFKIYRVVNAQSAYKEAGVNMAQVATDIDFEDNTIYISLRSNDAFQVVQPSP